MPIPIYQIDAFTDEVFRGNPAAVCPLETWLDDKQLQDIAAENNLSETAFFTKADEGYHLRWFTPSVEVALCGHATLAAAFVIFQFLDQQADEVVFQSLSGKLVVSRDNDLLILDFPVNSPQSTSVNPILQEALGAAINEVYVSNNRHFLMVLVDDESSVRELEPQFALLKQLEQDAVIVTAEADQADVDFVSRMFGPKVGIDEDPVTGSAHCVLAPFWRQRLQKKSFQARQISPRGGVLFCECEGERVRIAGKAVCYMKGEIIGCVGG